MEKFGRQFLFVIHIWQTTQPFDMINFHILLQGNNVSIIALCRFWKTVSAIDLYLSDTSWKHGTNDGSTNCSLLPKMTSARDSSKKWVATSYLANSIAVIVPTGVPLLSQYKRWALNKVSLFPWDSETDIIKPFKFKNITDESHSSHIVNDVLFHGTRDHHVKMYGLPSKPDLSSEI